MPTGTGKTRLFTSIIRDINIWGLRHNINFRILIIAHRSELIELQSPNQKIPDRKTKCVIETHLNIKQNVIFGAK